MGASWRRACFSKPGATSKGWGHIQHNSVCAFFFGEDRFFLHALSYHATRKKAQIAHSSNAEQLFTAAVCYVPCASGCCACA